MLIALAGCGSTTPGSHSGPLPFAAGVATLDVPLSDRELPVVATSAGHVMVFGGSTRRGYQPKGDGVVYDLERQVWTAMAPAPFDAALLYPAGVWTGAELVVVGTPCPDPEHDEDGEYVLCRRQPVAAAYSPTENSWRMLPRPQLPEPTGGYTILSRAVGFVDGMAVFSYQGRDVPIELLMIEPSSGTASFAAAPTEPCGVASRLFSFGPDFTGGFLGGVDPSPQTMRTREWLAGNGWRDVGEYPRPVAGPVSSDRITCGADTAAYVPVVDPPIGVSRDVHWFDAADLTWRPEPDLPPQGFAGLIQVATVRGIAVLALDDRLFTLAPGVADGPRTDAL